MREQTLRNMAVKQPMIALLLLVAVSGLALIACSNNSSSDGSAADVSAAGDIPDNQVFVDYQSTANGYSLQVPQGWARSESGDTVTFQDKFNSITIEVLKSASPPSVDQAKATDIPALKAAKANFQEVDVSSVDVSGSQVVRVRYRSDSEKDSVTGKTITLETDRCLFHKDGQTVALSMSAPVGADNVDAWNQIAASFKWG